MPQPTARDRFLALLRTSLTEGTLSKLTLGKYRGADATLHNIFIRPVSLKTGQHLAFLWRHATRDVTKNLMPSAGYDTIVDLLGRDFLDAHLFTTTQSAQYESEPGRLRVTAAPTSQARPVTARNDRVKDHLIPAGAPWLRALGVVNERGQPREGMADKLRQIQKFAELLTHLISEAFPDAASPLKVADMGSGKGYLTFALADVLGARATVRGIELRPELVDLCNRIARENGLADRLAFIPGSIAATPLPPGDCDVLIALHACDTATDDALATGIAAGAQLLVVAPCCQKELRRQLTAPPVLASALRHGIFQERQAEFVTDALRAQLLECAGYRTKVFEFISTEHTAKNLMIAAIKTPTADPGAIDRARAFAAFYGIRRQKLAEHLSITLAT